MTLIPSKTGPALVLGLTVALASPGCGAKSGLAFVPDGVDGSPDGATLDAADASRRGEGGASGGTNGRAGAAGTGTGGRVESTEAGGPDASLEAGIDGGDAARDAARDAATEGDTCKTIVSLVAGYYHTCVLFSDGSLECWGKGLFGELGYGNEHDVGDDEFPVSAGPVSVTTQPGVSVARISTGLFHMCAVLTDGSLRCWGAGNPYGGSTTIGDDELPSSVEPIALTTTPGVTVTEVSTSFEHTCALLSDGSVKCWGRDPEGELGNPSILDFMDQHEVTTAPPVSITTTPGVTVRTLAAGAYHTCALLSDASVVCWGKNRHGELGYGNTEDIGDDEAPSAAGPVHVVSDPGVTVTSLAAGSFHTCALLSDGSIRCWGQNTQGQLGYGNTNAIGDDETPAAAGPVPVTATPGVTVVSLSAGGEHTCALLSDGSVECWGYDSGGQLGYGSTEDIGDDELPSSVGAVDVTADPSVRTLAVAAGGEHSCVLLTGGTVKCWGANYAGQLGYGNVVFIGDDEVPASVGTVPLLACGVPRDR